MTYNFDTQTLVAVLALANTPLSLLQALLRQKTVGDLAKYLSADQLRELAERAATADEHTIADVAVAYAALAALARKPYTREVKEQLDTAKVPLAWADRIRDLIRELAVPTSITDLTRAEDRRSVEEQGSQLVGAHQ